MTDTDKPSIVELQRLQRDGVGTAGLLNAAPVLLEIVAADLELDTARCSHGGPFCTPRAGHVGCPVWLAIQRRTDALAKVRP